MKETFVIWETSRKLILNYLNQYSLEQLNKIPEGFSNNLIWNIAHVLVIQQRLAYTLSGLPMHISTEMFEKYQNGSKPDGKTSQAEVDEIKKLLTSLIHQTKQDFENGVFKEFHPYQTKTGFYLGSFEEAIAFNNFHEGIHYGIMMQIKKFV